jgi:hypothetical protein
MGVAIGRRESRLYTRSRFVQDSGRTNRCETPSTARSIHEIGEWTVTGCTAVPGSAPGVLTHVADDEQLRAFVRRLDPDEATDVLGFLVFLGPAQAVLL